MDAEKDHQAASAFQIKMNIIDFDTTSFLISCANRFWTLFRPDDLEKRWENLQADEFNLDERLPYWLELWPSCLALTAWLSEKRNILCDALCIEMGCGLGLSGMAAASWGAKVLAFDYECEALHYARFNEFFNFQFPCKKDFSFGPRLLWCAMDWRQKALKNNSAHYIWGADIIYEERFVKPVSRFLKYALHPHGTVWIAEPGRNIYKNFREEMISSGWEVRHVQDVAAPAFTCPQGIVPVQIWELQAPGSSSASLVKNA